MDEGELAVGCFIVSGCQPLGVFEFVKAALVRDLIDAIDGI